MLQAAGDRAFSAGADVNALNENAQRGITTALGGPLLDSERVTDHRRRARPLRGRRRQPDIGLRRGVR
jgi:enoyl-CoA hydratase/carnithine racemase